ncbi:hypothetical protein ACQ86D_23575 [Streptomyces galilaeus]
MRGDGRAGIGDDLWAEQAGGTQINGAPHIGTSLMRSLAYAMAARLCDRFGIRAEVFFRALAEDDPRRRGGHDEWSQDVFGAQQDVGENCVGSDGMGVTGAPLR